MNTSLRFFFAPYSRNHEEIRGPLVSGSYAPKALVTIRLWLWCVDECCVCVCVWMSSIVVYCV